VRGSPGFLDIRYIPCSSGGTNEVSDHIFEPFWRIILTVQLPGMFVESWSIVNDMLKVDESHGDTRGDLEWKSRQGWDTFMIILPIIFIPGGLVEEASHGSGLDSKSENPPGDQAESRRKGPVTRDSQVDFFTHAIGI
jgi:hypothetical protein